MHTGLHHLTDSVLRLAQGRNQFITPVEGLIINRWEHPTPPTSYSHKPSICLITQGVKRVILGDETYVYDANQFLISSVDLPIVANIVEATSDQPYIGLVLELDLKEISKLILECGIHFKESNQAKTGMAVGCLTKEILDAFQRLINLCEDEDSIPILAPAIKREIFYRLLKSPQGHLLHQVATAGSHSQQIARAIDWLYDHFHEPLSVSNLANYVGMSKSAFHQHFRAVTSMTPLQFQKKLRLNEARRLMLTESLDASAVTYQVGYESPSQFSREYARFFGLPPKRDIETLRESPYITQ
ncbi:AraC family transcriptional regulator [Maribrevibacterium harenarium]|uniref:AraC family transcriptional regulator n=1 Tax=Maribrevibacterium harenarium TaxID=2589817 RepID=A0A501WNP4_9GAMM|nr:AraC family transcriptional regulator [Maribrevibacterium harenarium]TPE47346.1 AraC family transcriptional regulator [Maribrevibacterium harenarium]